MRNNRESLLILPCVRQSSVYQQVPEYMRVNFRISAFAWLADHPRFGRTGYRLQLNSRLHRLRDELISTPPGYKLVAHSRCRKMAGKSTTGKGTFCLRLGVSTKGLQKFKNWPDGLNGRHRSLLPAARQAGILRYGVDPLYSIMISLAIFI
jgi:hypothetical protein